MQIVNETEQEVAYEIGLWGQGPSNSGTIPVDGLADLPNFDNQTNVWLKLTPTSGDNIFQINCENTGTGEQVEMALVFE